MITDTLTAILYFLTQPILLCIYLGAVIGLALVLIHMLAGKVLR